MIGPDDEDAAAPTKDEKKEEGSPDTTTLEEGEEAPTSRVSKIVDAIEDDINMKDDGDGPESMEEPGFIKTAASQDVENVEVEVATDGVTETISSDISYEDKITIVEGGSPPVTAAGEEEVPLFSPEEDPTTPVQSFQKITKIEDRLNEAIAQVEPSVQNRSPDIVPLARTYNELRKTLRQLVTASKKYHEAMLEQDRARVEWAKQLSILSEDSPIYNLVGRKEVGAEISPDDEGTELEHQDASSSLMVMQALGSAQVRACVQDYQDKILDYAVEWETIVTKRIDRDLNEVKQLQKDRLHYENKVAALRKKVNGLESKGKSPPEATVEKLERNEKKLDIAFQGHEIKAAQLCALIEEATNSGWKDLYPLVENALRWDQARLEREAMAFEGIPTTLQKIADKVGVNKEEVKEKEGSATVE